MELVKTYNSSLSNELCDALIEEFKNNTRKTAGITYAGNNTDIKKTTDLHSELWKDKELDKKLYEELGSKLQQYYIDINYDGAMNKSPALYLPYPSTSDSGYNIQHYTANDGFYTFHNDFYIDTFRGFRVLTFLWYLNDVEEGGTTEFYEGTKIKCEKGKLLIFPSTWTYAHKGNMPLSNDKYIATGWIYSKQF